MVVNTRYVAEVGRPKKAPEDVYRTPARSWKPGEELHARFKAAAEWKGETMTNVLKRLAWGYVEEVEGEQREEGGKP